jgi:two-component system response regulator
MQETKAKLDELLAATGARGDASLTTGPMTILLIDDDEDCRSFVRDAIRACGRDHRIVEHGDGLEALEYLRQADADSRPGLIFLDVEMPGLDGLETLRRIKADPRLSGIPVVMLTGVASPACMHRAAELGANSYTVKPARADQFLDTVQASATYWLTVHQYPQRHLAQADARR